MSRPVGTMRERSRWDTRLNIPDAEYPKASRIIRETIEECRQVAAAAGHAPSANAIKAVENIVLTRGSMFAASLLYDLERGGKVEAGHIVGDLLARARAAGIAAPNLRFAYAHLQAYERRRVRENISES